MREIKFRGKCKDTDEIVTGNLLVLLNACYIVRPTFFAARDDDPKHFSIFWDQTTKYPSQAAIMVYPVYPDSVAQLVGYDADGKEVYEGDALVDEEGMPINSLYVGIIDSDSNAIDGEIGDQFGDVWLEKE